ncbi:MAG: hypothetical protein ACREPG_04975 [Candidatus Binatia bacterium]
MAGYERFNSQQRRWFIAWFRPSSPYWLLPFAVGEKKWTHEQITGMQPERLAPLLRRAAAVYREPEYERAIGKLRGVSGDERWRLLFPLIAAPK